VETPTSTPQAAACAALKRLETIKPAQIAPNRRDFINLPPCFLGLLSSAQPWAGGFSYSVYLYLWEKLNYLQLTYTST
jgi:hypothetical protein